MKKVMFFALAAGACSGTDVQDFEGYGHGHPGSNLPQGGEVRFSIVQTPGGPVFATQAYAFSTPQPTEPIPPEGTCYRYADHAIWPTADYEFRNYLDLGPTV